MRGNWWEKNPVRFTCKDGCFRCCLKPGIVHMSDADTVAAADLLGLSKREFKSRFLVRENGISFIDVSEESPCPFLTLNGCSIHAAKPAQCRAYPFWSENLESRNHWRLAAGFCPGIDRGPAVAAETVKNALKIFNQ